MIIIPFALVPFLLMIFVHHLGRHLLGRRSTLKGYSLDIAAYFMTAMFLALMPVLFYTVVSTMQIHGPEGDSIGLLTAFIAIAFWGMAGIALVFGLPFSIFRRWLRR